MTEIISPFVIDVIENVAGIGLVYPGTEITSPTKYPFPGFTTVTEAIFDPLRTAFKVNPVPDVDTGCAVTGLEIEGYVCELLSGPVIPVTAPIAVAVIKTVACVPEPPDN